MECLLAAFERWKDSNRHRQRNGTRWHNALASWLPLRRKIFDVGFAPPVRAEFLCQKTVKPFEHRCISEQQLASKVIARLAVSTDTGSAREDRTAWLDFPMSLQASRIALQSVWHDGHSPRLVLSPDDLLGLRDGVHRRMTDHASRGRKKHTLWD
jgi:hypothetical protein